jgi:prepilin-type N-terminal cleavage/methylation domain-containing protein
MVSRIKNHKAFTLIEILIAVGILAGAIASIMPLIEVSSMLSVEDEKMLKAVTLANNKMLEVETEILADINRGKFPDESVDNGTFGTPFQDYDWEVKLTKVEIPLSEGSSDEGQSAVVRSAMKNIMKDISEAVRELKVTVTWPDRTDEGEEEFVITTHVVNIK